MATKWSPERRAKFKKTMRNKKSTPTTPGITVAINHLRYIDRLIRHKTLAQLTEVEHHAHLALRALTNK